MTTIAATLTAGPVRRHLVQLTAPMVLGILAMMAFNIVDTWFVAQLGELELAAMSFTFPVIMTLISLGIGLMAGTSSVLARSIGAGDWERVRRLTTDATLLALLLSVLCTIVGLLTLRPLFRLLGATEEVLPLIEDYMVIWYGGFVVVLVPMVGLGAVRATGDSKLQARVMGAAALFNVVLDPLLIFGLAGFPRLELEGAAWATMISRALTLLVGYWALQFKKGMLTYSVVRWAVVWDSWKRVLQVGLPAAGTNIIVPIGAGVVTAMIARYGPIAVAGFGAATRIEQLTLVVFYALSASIGPFVGQNLGAGQPARIAQALRTSAAFCLGFGIAIAVVLALAGGWLMRQFSDNAQVVGIGIAYLRIVPLSFGAYGIVMVANAAFNGIGRPLPAVGISVLRIVVLYLPLAVLGGSLFDVQGIFGAASAANLVAGAVAYFWFVRGCGSLR